MRRKSSQLRPSRRGSTNRAASFLILSAVVFVVLSLWLTHDRSLSKTELTVYCAAGLREPMEAIRAAYEQEHAVHGIRLAIRYGGSSTLLANLEAAKGPYVFLPADESYIGPAL